MSVTLSTRAAGGRHFREVSRWLPRLFAATLRTLTFMPFFRASGNNGARASERTNRLIPWFKASAHGKCSSWEGYPIINVNPGSSVTPESLIVQEREITEEHLLGGEDIIHFIRRSLGGLVIRGILNGRKPEKLERIVLIGTQATVLTACQRKPSASSNQETCKPTRF